MKYTNIILLIVFLVGTCGCFLSPRMTVTKDPGDCDTGVRFYRPKPYLLIKPHDTTTTIGTTKTTRADDKSVAISLEWLPDFSEEYSINVRPGIGTSHVSFTLEEGWNLTGTDQNLDSKTHENIKAIADAVTGIVGAAKGSDFQNSTLSVVTKEFVVRCTNVPLGYYESVIVDDCGTKKLCGWRYVGFAPFMACTSALPDENVSNTGMYGLAFENGVMVFKELNRIAGPANTTRCSVPLNVVVPLADADVEDCPKCKNGCKCNSQSESDASSKIDSEVPMETILLDSDEVSSRSHRRK